MTQCSSCGLSDHIIWIILDLCGSAYAQRQTCWSHSVTLCTRAYVRYQPAQGSVMLRMNEPAQVHASLVPCHRRAPEQAAKVHNCCMRKDNTVQRQFNERRNNILSCPGSSAWQIYWCMHSVANAGKKLTGRLGGLADMNMLAPAAFEEAPWPPRPAFAPGLPAAKQHSWVYIHRKQWPSRVLP